MPSLPLDDENLPLFTVGQVSEMLEIQQAFLRRLDEFRVVRPSRSAGGQRRYTRHEITVVQYVVGLADEGMTLTAIRRVLELEEQVKELEAQRDALVAARAALLDRLSAWPRGTSSIPARASRCAGARSRAWTGPARPRPPTGRGSTGR